MAKRDLPKLPDHLGGTLRALSQNPPPPHDIPRNRKAVPKPSPKARKRRKPKPPKVAGTSESAPVLKEGARPAARTTTWRRLKQEFDAAHRRGMNALRNRDYARVEEAIAKERDILEEQAAIVEEGTLPRPKRKPRKRKAAKKR